MSAILNSLNAHNLPIFQPILMIHVSKFMVYRAHSDKTYFLLGLLSPLSSNGMILANDFTALLRTVQLVCTYQSFTFNSRMYHTFPIDLTTA